MMIFEQGLDLNNDTSSTDSMPATTDNVGGEPVRPKKCSDYTEDCAQRYLKGKQKNGVYEIWPREGKSFRVLGDMTTESDGWTIFQRRDDSEQQIDFYRTWLEYKRGFGDLERQFWFGNDHLSMFSNQDFYTLRVDLEDFDGQKRFAIYHTFTVANELDKYRLNLGACSTIVNKRLR